MKIKNIHFFIFLALGCLHGNSILSVYTTVAHYSGTSIADDKDTNRSEVFVFGDVSITGDDSHTVIADDKFQATQMFNYLLKTASSGRSTAFIIEGALSEASRASQILTNVDELQNCVQVGLRTQQALFALIYRKQYGSIDFFYANRSGAPFTELIQVIEHLNQVLSLYKFKDNHKPLSLYTAVAGQEEKKKILLKKRRAVIRKKLDSFLSDFTVKQFKHRIEKIKRKNISQSSLEYIRNSFLLDCASDFVEDYADATFLRDVVWFVFSHRSLGTFQQANDSWIYPLHSMLVQYGLEVTMQRAMKKYPAIIVSSSQASAEKMCQFLEDKNFKLCHKAEQNNKPLNNFEFLALLDTYSDVVGWNYTVRSCDRCLVVQRYQEEFITCHECQNFWYCSEKCAKKDKQDDHKRLCSAFGKKK